MIRDMIYMLNAIGLPPDGSSTVHIHTQTIHRTTQFTNWEECRPCTVFASYTLAFALRLRKKHGKISVRVETNSVRVGKTSVKVGTTSFRVGKTSVRLEKPQSWQEKTSVKVGKTSVRVGNTSVRVEKPQSW